ncbi:MAG: hypothetical protein AVDCRST_MAG95-1048 [uncultured Adhaeribacter sp.]|uniref:Uncharacterized protein n=1 Tax=uncultured Adhaeribacter sp. TaxID=448109 RepID=A0A6J4HVR3_9BACT|nr:MAG: hypothetical protein AVDCRST_MAG95-1048 [uncultured Adhaeribacter sp.]
MKRSVLLSQFACSSATRIKGKPLPAIAIINHEIPDLLNNR